MHENSKLLFEKYVPQLITPHMRILEIGPDAFPSTFQRITKHENWDTLDIYKDDRLTYTSLNEYSFPIEDQTYDLVISGQVIEHVRKIWLWMPELARITKKGGKVITINPISWPYHEAPIDCWRIYPEGMRALYEDAGMEVDYSFWGSLEKTRSKRRRGGRSKAQQSKLLRVAYALMAPLGFHEECSFDAITIGRKL